MRTVVRTEGVSLLIVLCCLTATIGCQSLDFLSAAPRPSAHIAGVRLADIGVSSATMLFDLDIENPHSVPLPLVNLDYSLASRGQEFMNGKDELQGTIPARGSKRISVPAKLDYRGMLSALKDVRPGSVVPYDAELGLSVDVPVVGSMRLPLRKSGQLPIPTAPRIESLDVAWDTLSLDEAGGVVKLKLANRNSFAIDLAKLSYNLFLGDTRLAESSLAKPSTFAADGGTGTLEIPLKIVPRNLGAAAFKILSGGSKGFRIDGTMDVGTPFGPMSLPIGGD